MGRGLMETSGVRRTNQPSALQRRTSVLGVGALLAIAACLNPMPEEFPSERPVGAAGSAAGPSNAGGGGGAGTDGSSVGGGAGTGGLPINPGSAGGGGAAGSVDQSVPDSGGDADAGASSPADAGSEAADASP